MNDIKISTTSGEFLLNNNSDKYDRAKREAGPRASSEEVLAYYDKYAGLIQTPDGKTVATGTFWIPFEKWLAERPEYNRVLEQREKTLDEGENSLIQLGSLNIEHKRSFLGTLMTISAAIIAGLFFMFTNSDFRDSSVLIFLAKMSGLGHAIFILTSSFWLLTMLSQESEALSSKLEFVRESKKDFVNSVGTKIVNLASYDRYREEKYREEGALEKKIVAGDEFYFAGVCLIFVISSLPLIVMFLAK